MTFDQTTPAGIQLFDLSQAVLLQNNQSLDSVFNVDHYAFSDQTVNNGKHNVVTTPLTIGATHPTTNLNENKFYAMRDSANLGVIQYSRGEENQRPTPITSLHSSTTPIVLLPSGSTTIFDFTGISRCMCNLYVANLDTANKKYAEFLIARTNNPPGIISVKVTGNTNITSPSVSGNLLIVTNTSPNTYSEIFWTLQFLRIEND